MLNRTDLPAGAYSLFFGADMAMNGVLDLGEAFYDQVDVDIVDKAWTHPADLTDNISPDWQWTDQPWVAMDDNGNAIIVWHQFLGDYYYEDEQIFKSEYRIDAI